ncbi:MAG: hypothetical protein H7336_08565 [Bacteriovorax sp.]|nr:hypothetical protein [Bacteriovorax sp.]
MKIQNKNSLIHNQKGQAVFELIIFLPFLVFLYSIYYTTGNSISGSINQQKAVRGYFYSTTKGNSYLNTKLDLASFSDNNIQTVGFSALGWREKSTDEKNAYAPCFKFSSLLKNSSTEGCDDSTRDDESSSRYIRVFTYYGVCGPVYTQDDEFGAGKFYEINPSFQSIIELCSLSLGPPS